MRRPLIMILAVGLCLLPLRAIYSTCGGGGGGGGGSMKPYVTSWMEWDAAKAKAKQQREGIILYFPPVIERKSGPVKVPLHSIFSTKAMAEHSRNSAVVKAEGEKFKKLREEYHVEDHAYVIVVTDWFGNPIGKPLATRNPKARLPIKSILRAVKSADKFVDSLRAAAAKRLAEAERSFAEKHWRSAIKDYDWVAALHGIEESGKAHDRLQDIAVEGRRQIEAAKKQAAKSKPDAIHELKKISREFKGSVVEQEAEKAIAELSGKESSYVPSHDDVDAGWAAFMENFEYEEIDEAALEKSLQVQDELLAGAAAEKEHHYDEALQHYQAATELDPTDAVVLRYLGEYNRHDSGRWDLARKEFEKILTLPNADAYSRAIALHGLGKMTIHSGKYAKGVALLEQSVATCPNQLAYRNLAVYWHSEGKVDRAEEYIRKAVALDPDDPYTRVFQAAFIALHGDPQKALDIVQHTPFDLSMCYNIACVYSAMHDKKKTLELLHRHFYEYEFTDAVRAKEMWEARSDINFKWLRDDPDFVALTHLADAHGG